MDTTKLTNENVNCNFCGSNDAAPHITLEGWHVVRCRSCGFHYTNPRPTLESLPMYYTEEYFQGHRFHRYYHKDGSLKLESGEYTNRITDIEHLSEKRGRLLELGAARGGFLKDMRLRGWEVHGVEISADAVALAKELYDLSLFCGLFSDYPETMKFDVISMYQTLEHLHDPKQVIEKAYRMLNPGGLLVIEVPNIKGFDMKFSKERRLLSFDLPLHLSHFTEPFLIQSVKNLGFEIALVDRYLPQFMLNILEKRAKASAGKQAPTSTAAPTTTNNSGPVPMLRHHETSKTKLLKDIGRLMPGWRITVIGRKP